MGYGGATVKPQKPSRRSAAGKHHYLEKERMNTTQAKKQRQPARLGQSSLRTHLRQHYILYLMLIPGLTFFLLFCYKPMGGILMAFENYSYKKGLFGSPWIGLKNFQRFFSYKHCWRIIRNTVLLNLTNTFWTMPIAIIFALLVNELREGPLKKFYTTVSYLPHFVSVVVVVSIFFQFLIPSGIINTVIEKLGGKGIAFFSDAGWFRTIYNSISVWKETGWNAVIYIAALAGVDQQLYEAAKIDGANRIQQHLHVSLPGIAPTIAITLIMHIGRLMSSGTDMILLLYNEKIYETADVIGTYVYRVGLHDAQYGYSTAVNLFSSVIGMILLILANRFSKKVSDTSMF